MHTEDFLPTLLPCPHPPSTYPILTPAPYNAQVIDTLLETLPEDESVADLGEDGELRGHSVWASLSIAHSSDKRRLLLQMEEQGPKRALLQ